MSLPEPIRREVSDLFWSLSEGSFSPTDVEQLERLAGEYPEVRKLYAQFMAMCGILQWERTSSHAVNLEAGSHFIVSELPPTDPSPFIIHSSSTAHYPLSTLHSLLFSYTIAAAVVGLGLLVAWAWKLPTPVQIAVQSPATQRQALVESEAPMHFVGRITGMVDCQWSDPNTAVPGLVAVPLGRKYALSSGLMEVTYDTGAKVILQGPCTYEVESKAGGYLSVGKLTARVENKVERRTKNDERPVSRSSFLTPHSYFAVRTPTATVTDLGTEFGVEVRKDGLTMSHVFRGSVALQVTSSDGKAEGAAKVLHANESARVEDSSGQGVGNRIKVLDSSAKPTDFVREIPKRIIKMLDLADVVAGGDGFSGRHGRGIDPRNGRAIDGETKERLLLGDGKYHRVEGMRLVDGVFIPNGADGPVQLDSAGHAFAEFPATENKTGGLVFAGKEGDCGAELGGVDFASSGHTVLSLYANKGVTFDLDAIRRANPGWKLMRFRGVAGIAALAGPPDNLIPNGDFTSGIGGWIGGGATGSMAADTTSPDRHNMLLKSSYEGYYNIISVPLKPGQQYDLSFMAASPSRTATDGPAGSLVVRLWWIKEDRSGVIGTNYNVPAADLNGGWATYTTSWTVPAGCDGDYPQLTFDTAGDGTGELYAIDNVVLTLSPSQGYADFWVFVDGQKRFARWQVNRYSGAMPAVVPIEDSDRFLTLVATDGGNGRDDDNTMFGDPRLELLSAKAAASTLAAEQSLETSKKP